jgi:hypothetical protein
VTSAELRSARLLFAGELANGAVSEADLDGAAVRRAVGEPQTPAAAVRAAQRLAMKIGRLDYERSCARPLQAARRAVLGDAARGNPRVLLRVDEFPHFRVVEEPRRYGSDAFARFHAILADRGIAYLLAVLPEPANRPLDPACSGGRHLDDGEVEVLRQVARDGVAFAVHGLDHRTRHRRPSRRSELDGLSAAALRERLAAAEARLAERGTHHLPIFVAPFNRFDARQYPILAERYTIVCGGPESVARLGFARTPIWRGNAVYVPAYPPFYGKARDVTRALRTLIDQECAVWVPVVLHWGWEADGGLDDMSALADALAGRTVGWDVFLGAVEASK